MLIANLWKAIILGIIEGITEWLPISSTGHLILVNEFIKMQESEDFMSMFNVVIQLGAILAVVVLFFHKLNPFSPQKNEREKHDTWQLWFKVVVAAAPAAILGLLFDDWLDEHLYNFVVVAFTLIIYGIAFIVIEKRNETHEPLIKSLNSLTYQTALIIGSFQVLSLIPGTSRSGATILGAILIGCSRYVATEFSFFLGIPIMFGASGLKIFKFLLKGNSFSVEQTLVLFIASAVAFFISIIAIKFLVDYLKRHNFSVFGKYRIALGAIVIAYWLIVKVL
ncbi:undecaprenyl-diphosphatase [Pilibacter termitis]|uniref:Undecaprenyl-diphosphatase n=1 Tax=Pilibacter termitis TaxID=263852 RepID=A0A1T4KN48_9ENTE|nr:undecaprenyl-diphosphate phosphatase [Pilibacter termitis]SJZ43834.1 undecaprenyl-diphosphatase [Pilibacter termitis]